MQLRRWSAVHVASVLHDGDQTDILASTTITDLTWCYYHFNLDRTTLALTSCFSASKLIDLIVQLISMGKEHTFVDILAYLRPSSGLCVP